MWCSGDREKGDVAMEEKWDYVNLDDFKSESCWTPFSYFFLWVFLIFSFAVYGVDTFTAINLLAFSRWAGSVQPAIPFYISRWIFTACILASFILLGYRWFHAVRAIRSGSITRSFLDPLAVRIQSVRFGKEGRGYKRFLVFAELTKDRKAAEYVALYAYFSFQFWMNTVFADGPRQVINAITLYSVMQMDLIPGGKNAAHDDGSSSIGQFFNNIKILADSSKLQAVVLFGMLFTLVIWVLSVLKLISAIILYLLFLFHHIPAEDGTLSRYCSRKVAKRLKRIVHRKNNKALAKGLKLQSRPPTAPSLVSFDSTPTLPSISADKRPTALSRTTTQTTLPPYSRSTSFTASDHEPTLPGLAFDAKPPLSRTRTDSSALSESSSLTGNAAAMGYSPLDSRQQTFHPVPPVPPIPTNIPQRILTPHHPGSRASPASHSSGESRNTRAGHAPSLNNTSRNGRDAGYRGLDETNTGYQPYHQSYTPAPEYAPRALTGTPNYDSLGRNPESSHYDPYGPRAAPRSNLGQSYYHQEDNYSNPPPPRSQATHTTRTITPTRSGNPAPQPGAFTAFNPAPPYPSSPGYHSSNHMNVATASGPHNAPPSPSFNRPDTHQY